MKDNHEKIEERIENVKNVYLKIEKLIDDLPDVIPGEAKKTLKKTLLDDKELKTFMKEVDHYRPPKLFLIGRTGSGKSSLINAMCDAYVANVDDVKSCTAHTTKYPIKDGDRTLMEILDSRGIAESEALSEVTAEEQILKELTTFDPDAAILLLNATHRDGVNEDAAFMKKVADTYQKRTGVRLHVLAVINKCDEAQPARYKEAIHYPEGKIRKINEVQSSFRRIIRESGLKIDGIVTISSLIDWATVDGEPIDVDAIKELSKEEVEALTILFDGRYHMDELFEALYVTIPDVQAQAGLKMAFRLQEVVKALAKSLVKIFSTISATVALTPIPVSDMVVLTSMQSIMVMMIAMLSGREMSLDEAKEFIMSLSTVSGAGFVFRTIAQQATKLFNGVFPGAGSAISSGIASFGTSSIGHAAIAYFIDDQDLKTVKKHFQKSIDEHKKKHHE